jgi:hypothetical protein
VIPTVTGKVGRWLRGFFLMLHVRDIQGINATPDTGTGTLMQGTGTLDGHDHSACFFSQRVVSSFQVSKALAPRIRSLHLKRSKQTIDIHADNRRHSSRCSHRTLQP